MPRRARHIIAVGGFAPHGRSRALHAYILAQTGRPRPRVCFVPTASGDDDRYIERFYRVYGSLGARASHLTLFKADDDRFARLLARQDAIFVGGGNTKNMLLLWRFWGIDRMLQAAYRRGAIIAGSSAGAMCWFEQGLTDSIPGRYTPMDCLGLIAGSYCPHFDSEPRRRPIYRRLIARRRLKAGYAIEDDVALHFVNGRLAAAVSTRRAGRAFFIASTGGRVRETMIQPGYLTQRNAVRSQRLTRSLLPGPAS